MDKVITVQEQIRVKISALRIEHRMLQHSLAIVKDMQMSHPSIDDKFKRRMKRLEFRRDLVTILVDYDMYYKHLTG